MTAIIETLLTEQDTLPLLSDTVFGIGSDNMTGAAIAAAQIATDLMVANDGQRMITIDAVTLAAAIIEAMECCKRGYMELNIERNPIATQIIESVMTWTSE